MNNLMQEIWPFLLTAALPSIAMYVGYIHQLKTKVAVLERTIEDQAETLDKMQKRMDSHSKKQDEILKAISDMELKLVTKLAATEKQIAVITTTQENIISDVREIKQNISQIKKL